MDSNALAIVLGTGLLSFLLGSFFRRMWLRRRQRRHKRIARHRRETILRATVMVQDRCLYDAERDLRTLQLELGAFGTLYGVKRTVSDSVDGARQRRHFELRPVRLVGTRLFRAGDAIAAMVEMDKFQLLEMGRHEPQLMRERDRECLRAIAAQFGRSVANAKGAGIPKWVEQAGPAA